MFMRKVRSICRMLFWISVASIVGYLLATEITAVSCCYIPHSSAMPFSSGWTDSDTGTLITDSYVPVRHNETLHLECQLPSHMFDGMTLYVWIQHFHVTAAVNGQRLTENNMNYPFLFGYHQISQTWMPVMLHSSDSGKTLSLTIKNNGFNGLFDVRDIRLGSPDSGFNMLLRDNASVIIESIIILLIGILLLIYYFVLRHHHYDAYRLAILFLSSSALSSCVWIISSSPLPQLVIRNSAAVSAICFYSYMLLPVFLILFFREMLPERKQAFLVFLLAYMILITGGTIAVSTGLASVYLVYPLNHLFSLILIIAVISFAVSNYRHSHNKDMLYLIAAYLFIVSGTLGDMLIYYLHPQPDMTWPYRAGLLLFILVLCFTTITASLQQFSDLRAAQHYKELAYIDKVTGGNTRQRFDEIIQTLPYEDDYWFIHMNILYFRIINEAFGREKCDELLSGIYSACASLLYAPETICNLGDSCLALYIREDSIDALRTRLTAINSNIQHEVHRLLNSLNVQMEYCVYKVDCNNTDLNHIQDHALMAKRNPDAEYWSDLNAYVYSEECRKKLLEDKQLENLLDKALDNREIQPFLQPKVSPHTGEIKGAEALARWISPEYGLIYPSVFIPLFERNGSISRIDLSIFEQVCNIINRWLAQGLTPPVISVNISKAALQDTGFFDRYINILRDKKVPAKYLEFELTESIAYNNMKLISEILEKIHAIGSRCSMDDFGKSYSNLNALGSLPFDTVKMDMCFFDSGFPEDHKKYLLVTDSMKLLKDLHMEIVTEGIETAPQVDALAGMGVDLIQGYYYAKPLSPDDFDAFWAQHRALS